MNFIEYIILILILVGSFPYAVRTYQNKTNPNIVSWSLWLLMNTTFVLTYTAIHEKITNIVGIVSGIFNCAIIIFFILLKKYKSIRITKIEIICIIICLIVIGLWIFMQNNILLMRFSMYATIVADVFASIPQIFSSWKEPEKDKALSWTMVTTAYAIGIFNVNSYTFSGYILPVYMFLSCFFITIPLVVYNIKTKRKFLEWI